MKRKREPVMYYIIGILSMIAAVVLIGCTARYIKEEQRETRQESVEALKKYEKTEIEKMLLTSYESTPEDIEEEMYCDSLELLSVCVEAEAGNQPMEGRRMVADVILNRVDHPDYPDTISEVIGQPYRFSSYWDGNMESVIEPSEETIKAVQMELRERSYPGLLYFKEGGYSEYGTQWRQVGDHYFSTE